MILYLGIYPLPQSDLIFRNGGSILIKIRSQKQSYFSEENTTVLAFGLNLPVVGQNNITQVVSVDFSINRQS